MIPNILSIAGSDPSGGAGIQADIKAISANGGYAMAVITALTVQNTFGVQTIETVNPGIVQAQIQSIRGDILINAIKIGMLGTVDGIRAVSDVLSGLAVPIVLDPVIVAKGGSRLLSQDALDTLRDTLLPRATIMTPNLSEAADLLDLPQAKSREDMMVQAEALLIMGPGAVLLKGGHLDGDQCPDLFFTADGFEWLEGSRCATKNTHGTGCTLSSALATHLGVGHSLIMACALAKNYVAGAITAAGMLSVGNGYGPVHHYYSF